MPKLLLDSANLDEIDRYTKSRAIAGVTTNPSLMAKEKKGDYFGKIDEIIKVIDRNAREPMHLSAEVISLDPSVMLDQAERLKKLCVDRAVILHVKIPIMLETLPVISALEYNITGVKVNATACMTAEQAYLASEAGASIVSFFYRRMLDVPSVEPSDEIRKYHEMTHEKRAKVICGSIRKEHDLYDAFRCGADYVTVPAKIIDSMVRHQKTDYAISKFQSDIEAWQR